MKSSRLLLLACVLVVRAGEAYSQALISLPDTSARQVDTLLVPLTLQGLLPGDEILGIEATVSTGTPAAKVIGTETAGTLSSGASTQFFSATGKLAVAFTTPLTNDGTIVFLRVATSGSAGYTYPLTLSSVKLNEGTPAVTGDNGSLYIRYISVQPNSPSGVVLGDTVQFSVIGNPVTPISWTSSNTGVGTVDSTGKFIAIAEGAVRVTAVDTEGKRDSTTLFTVNPITLKTLTLSVPDTSGHQTLEIAIPVRTSDVTGLGITSALFTVTYNGSSLEFLHGTSAGTLTESWTTPLINANTPGSLVCALAGTSELIGSGPVLFLVFRVKGTTLSSSTLGLTNVEFNEGIVPAVDPGQFTPLAAPPILVGVDRHVALKGETVTVTSTTGGTGPYHYLSSDPSIATADSASGTLTVLTRGPVQIIAVDDDGFQGASDTIETFDFPATLGSSSILETDSADIGLVIGQTTELGITSFDVSVAYDTAVAAFGSLHTAGHLADGFSVIAKDSAGLIRVAAAGVTPLSGAGTLMMFRFGANTPSSDGDSTGLVLSSVTFNEPGPATPKALPVHGSLVVSVPTSNQAPTFTVVLPDTMIQEGDTLRFSYVATDPDGDSLRYTLLQGGSMAALDSVAGLLTFVAAIGSAGPHTVEARVSDGELSATTSAVVVITANASNDSSLILDGSGDRARITDSTPVNPSANPAGYQVSGTAITVEAWVYPMDAPAPGHIREIITRPGNNGFGVDPYRTFGLGVIGADGFSSVPTIAFMVSDGTTPIGGGGETAVRDTAAVKVGEWTHVAGTYDGANANLYINGVLVQSLPFTTAIGAGGTGLYVGGHAFGAFRGLIDEVRLWNVTRSMTDIQNNKDVTLAGNETGLAGYWPFDSTYVSETNLMTVDMSPNKNDLMLQFQAHLAGFPQGSTVQIAPTNLSLSPAAVGGGYALTETPYNALLVADGWPAVTITVTQKPETATIDGDSIHWTPGADDFGWFPFAATLANTSGSISDTVQVFVEAIRTASNQVAVDISHRGKIGAFGNYGKGVSYNGKIGLYAGDFSLVDRNDEQYAGGLYSVFNSFRPMGGFTSVPSRFADFTAFSTSFTDEWEPTNRIGVKVLQTAHVKQTAPDDKYTIIEYRIVNESGSTIDDLFAQMTADFDLGSPPSDRGGYDSTLGLSYAYQDGGATNSNYYGFQLLGQTASGAAVWPNGTDAQYVRSTANLTTFPELPANATDTRNQISTGPFTLAANETLTVAFAYLAADDLDQLRSTAASLMVRYAGPGAPNVSSLWLDGVSDRGRIQDFGPVNPSATPSAYQVSGTSITVEAWVYPVAAPGPGEVHEIIARPSNNGFALDPYRTFGLVALGADGASPVPTIAFSISDGTSLIGEAGEITVRDTAQLKVGEWTHVAGTYDGSNVKLYINGDPVHSQAFTSPIGTGSYGLLVGMNAFGALRGLVDELRLWNVTRSEAQIRSAKDVTLHGNEAGLAGYWPFDETYVSGSNVATPDMTANHNDFVLRFGAGLEPLPHGAVVERAPTELRIVPASVGGGYAVTETPYKALLLADGFPAPTIVVTSKPTTATMLGDTLFWTPGPDEFGWFPILATASNSVGTLDDTVSIFVEAVRAAANQVVVDVSHRGKVGAFGGFDKGVTYNGKNGLYTGDFSLVDRNDMKFAGGLYSTFYSFEPAEGFGDVPSRFTGFTAFRTSFTDAWEPNRIGVRVFQTAHVKQTAPDDKYTIIEYRVINESGAPLDDLFAQMSADFDVGGFSNNLGGYDATLGLTYSYESGAPTNSAYYGFQLLSHSASGGGAIQIGQDTSWFRSTSNLTTFTPDVVVQSDTRNQISAGPFALAANETLTVAFAYLAADDLNQLKAAAQASKTVYVSQTTSVAAAEDAIPKEYALDQNFPNPFNPSTNIRFALPTASKVRLEVYNILGQVVGVLQDQELEAGYHTVRWQAPVSAGLYFYRIQAGSLGNDGTQFSSVRRMVLMK